MSLDPNLFTLTITPRAESPQVIELIDSQETVHYRKELAEHPQAETLYEFNVFDPLSGSCLASVTAPSAASKHKTIELHNPSVPIELKYTGTFTFRWTFLWEEHSFEWKREECYLIRKPDPPVLVAITKEPPGRIKTKAVQILDYNLNRFDIHDRKGLEIVLLSALLSFQDYSDELHKSRREENASSSSPAPAKPIMRVQDLEVPAPQLPPKPQKSGPERVAEMQKGELGEIQVEDEGEIDDYAQYCTNLLEGDNMLFVVLRSSTPATVSKVLQIAHQTKRIRHKAGSEDDLHQYVQSDVVHSASLSGKKGPRIIKLDNTAESTDKYKPPESLTVYLSKIPMPELEPKAQESKDRGREIEKADYKGKGKEKNDKQRKRREQEEEAERKAREKAEKKAGNKGTARARSQDPYEPRAEATTHSKTARSNNHLSPSPSQLNYPTIYAAPNAYRPRSSLTPSSIPGSYHNDNRTHQRSGSSPAQPPRFSTHLSPAGPYPNQRPASAQGAFLGFPQQAADHRASSPNSKGGFLNKMKVW